MGLCGHLGYPDVGERGGTKARSSMSVGRVQGCQDCQVLEFSLATLRWLLDGSGGRDGATEGTASGEGQGAQGAHVLEFSLRTLRWLLDQISYSVRGMGSSLGGGHSIFKERGSGWAGPVVQL